MIQELHGATTEARQLLAEIGLRFKAGDVAEGLLERFEQLLTTILSQMSNAAAIPPELRNEIADLLELVQATVATGTQWLDAAGAELASQNTQARLRRAYGVP
ncbi:MAG: hypothetical protein ACKODX_17565 [Gemmata sp.]